MGLLYRFTAFRFSNLFQPMDGHLLQLAFGRQVAGRLALQLSAGPELGLFRSLQGPGSAFPTVTLSRKVYWTLDSALTYQIRRTVLKLGYDHGLTDGAGFLAGAITDQGSGSIDGPLSRTLAGKVVVGYARNQGLIVTRQQPSNEIYRDWFTEVTVSQAWSRRLSIFLSYQVQRQASNFACAGFACGNGFTRHLISLGMTGRAQPRAIE
jgi:hypothetical protein